MIATATTRSRAGLGRGAFTLIEILATMALLAIVLPPVMRGFSLCMAASGTAKDQALASQLARGKLEELLSSAQWQQSQTSGDFGEDWPQYKWNAQVVSWQESNLRELSVTVSWTRQGQQRVVTLTSLIFTGESSTGVTNTEATNG